MIENILTNYSIKFENSQLDYENISKSKLYYNIYNNKIYTPLQKFWFSVSNIKYSNNYANFKTIRFVMNHKNENILQLINYIKDISNYLVEKLNPTFENINVDYPWKEYEQYPYIFSFFTNTNTLFIDSSCNEIEYSLLNNNDYTYSIIFEIASIRIMPLKLDTIETYTIKINLVLILIKQNEKQNEKNDLKKYLFTNFTNITNKLNESNNYNESSNFNHNSNVKKLPFLNNISGGFLLNKIDKDSINKNLPKTNSTTKLIISTDQILKAINSLKKVEIKKELNEELDEKNNDNNNDNQINAEYVEKKNNLKKVKTKEKSLLKNLQKKKKKKEKSNIINDDL